MLGEPIDRFLAWWYGRRLRASNRQRAEAPPEPLGFPLSLGARMSEVRAAIHREYGDDSALDNPLPRTDGRQDRLRLYMLTNPGGASVNVAYAYREQDEIIWSIRIDNAAPQFTGTLGEVALTSDVASITTLLGPPTDEVQFAPVIRTYHWELPDTGYNVSAYSEVYDDIGGYHRAGEVSSIEWFSRTLGPESYNPMKST